MVIPAEYEFALPFSEGVAAVQVDGKWGFIDKAGTVVVEPQYEQAGPFSEGLAAVYLPGEPNLKVGFINQTGQMVVEPIYSDFYSTDSYYRPTNQLEKGLISVAYQAENADERGWHGYIDSMGKVVYQAFS